MANRNPLRDLLKTKDVKAAQAHVAKVKSKSTTSSKPSSTPTKTKTSSSSSSRSRKSKITTRKTTEEDVKEVVETFARDVLKTPISVRDTGKKDLPKPGKPDFVGPVKYTPPKPSEPPKPSIPTIPTKSTTPLPPSTPSAALSPLEKTMIEKGDTKSKQFAKYAYEQRTGKEFPVSVPKPISIQQKTTLQQQYDFTRENIPKLVEQYLFSKDNTSKKQAFQFLVNAIQQTDKAALNLGLPDITTKSTDLDKRIRTYYAGKEATGISNVQYQEMIDTRKNIKNAINDIKSAPEDSSWVIGEKTYNKSEAINYLENALDNITISMKDASGKTLSFNPEKLSLDEIRYKVGTIALENIASQLKTQPGITPNLISSYKAGKIGLGEIQKQQILSGMPPRYKGIIPNDFYLKIMFNLTEGNITEREASRQLEFQLRKVLPKLTDSQFKNWERKNPMFENPEITSKYEDYKKTYDAIKNKSTGGYLPWKPTKYGTFNVTTRTEAKKWLNENPTPSEYKNTLVEQYKSKNKFLVNFDTLKEKTHERALYLKVTPEGKIETTMEYKKAEKEEWEELGKIKSPLDIYSKIITSYAFPGTTGTTPKQLSKAAVVGATHWPITIYTKAADVLGWKEPLKQWKEEGIYQAGYEISQAARAGHRGEGWGGYLGQIATSPAMTDIVYPFALGAGMGAGLGVVQKAGAETGAQLTRIGGKALTIGGRQILYKGAPVIIGGKTIVHGGTALGRGMIHFSKYSPYAFGLPFAGAMGADIGLKAALEEKGKLPPGTTLASIARYGTQFGMAGLGAKWGAELVRGPVPKTYQTKSKLLALEKVTDPYGFRKMTPSQAKASFRKLSLKIHPDKLGRTATPKDIETWNILETSYRIHGTKAARLKPISDISGRLSSSTSEVRARIREILGKPGIPTGKALTVWQPQPKYAFDLKALSLSAKGIPKIIKAPTSIKPAPEPVYPKSEIIDVHGIKVIRPVGTVPGIARYPSTIAIGKEILPPGQYPTIGRQPTIPTPSELYTPPKFRKPSLEAIQQAKARGKEIEQARIKEQKRLSKLPKTEEIKLPGEVELSRMQTRAFGRTDMLGKISEKFKMPKIFKPTVPRRMVFGPELEKVPIKEMSTKYSKYLEKRMGRIARPKSKIEEITIKRDKWGKVVGVEEKPKISYTTIEEPEITTKRYIEEISPRGEKQVTPRKYAEVEKIKIFRPKKTEVVRSKYGRGIREGKETAYGFSLNEAELRMVSVSPYLPKTVLTQKIFSRLDVRRAASAVFESEMGRAPTTKELNNYMNKLKTEIKKHKLYQKTPLEREVLLHELLHQRYPKASESKIESLTSNLLGIKKPFTVKLPHRALPSWLAEARTKPYQRLEIIETTKPGTYYQQKIMNSKLGKIRLNKKIKQILKDNPKLSKIEAKQAAVELMSTKVKRLIGPKYKGPTSVEMRGNSVLREVQDAYDVGLLSQTDYNTLTNNIKKGLKTLDNKLVLTTENNFRIKLRQTMTRLPTEPLQIETPYTERPPGYIATGKVRPRIEALVRGERGIDFRIVPRRPTMIGKGTDTVEKLILDYQDKLKPRLEYNQDSIEYNKESNRKFQKLQAKYLTEMGKEVRLVPGEEFYPVSKYKLNTINDVDLKDISYEPGIGTYLKSNIVDFRQRSYIPGTNKFKFLKGVGVTEKIIPELPHPLHKETRPLIDWLHKSKITPRIGKYLNKTIDELMLRGELDILGRKLDLRRYRGHRLAEIPITATTGDTIDIGFLDVHVDDIVPGPDKRIIFVGVTSDTTIDYDLHTSLSQLTKRDAEAIVNRMKDEVALGGERTYPEFDREPMIIARKNIMETIKTRKYFMPERTRVPTTRELLAEQRRIMMGEKPLPPLERQIPYKIKGIEEPAYYTSWSKLRGDYINKIKSYNEMLEAKGLKPGMKKEWYGRTFSELQEGKPPEGYGVFRVKERWALGEPGIEEAKLRQSFIKRFTYKLGPSQVTISPELVSKIPEPKPILDKLPQEKMLIVGKKGLTKYKFVKTAEGLRVKYEPKKPVEPIIKPRQIEKIIQAESTKKIGKAIYKTYGISKSEFEAAYENAMKEIQKNRIIEKEIERSIARQTGRQTPRETSRTITRNVSRIISKEIQRQINRPVSRQIERQLERQIERQLERQIGKQLSKQLERQLERQIPRQIPRVTPLFIPEYVPPSIPTPTTTESTYLPTVPEYPPAEFFPPLLGAKVEQKRRKEMRFYHRKYPSRYKERQFILPTFTKSLQQPYKPRPSKNRFIPPSSKIPKTLKM